MRDGMSMNMPAIFTSSTTVTLFFSSWTTTSTFTYLLALSVLFFLAFLNRFLAALRFQLQSRQPATSEIPILRPPKARRYGNIPKARLSPLPVYMRVEGEGEEVTSGNGEEEAGLVSETAPTEQTGTFSWLRRGISRLLPSWKPRSPWSLQGDGGRALLEGFRAFVGYTLMLAVMTFNVGIFCAVLVGIAVGEMVLGRYTQHSNGAWADGACHDE